MAAVAAVVGLASTPVRADILVTAEAPGVEQSQVAGVVTMNFNSPTYSAGSYTSLSSAIGTYTAPGSGLAIMDPKVGTNGDFGGATGNGLTSGKETQYMAIGAQSGQTQATLTLTQDRNYFGMYWLAGDNKNFVDFYRGTTLVGSENISQVISYITSNPTVNNAYYGNPNTGADKTEPFVYLNFYGQNGTTFNKLVFRNLDTTTGYESDNHSVATLVNYTPSGTTVGTITASPEPSSWAIGLVVTAAAGVAARRRRRSGAVSCTGAP
jgi:hypothetical protein